MDKPKTPETLESETPFDKTPEEASGTNHNGSELASVSDISDVLGAKNAEVESREAVEDARLGDVSEAEAEEDSARFGGEKSCGNVAEIVEGCADESEKEAKSRNEENEVELVLLESHSVGDEDVGVKEETSEENSSESNGIASSEGISLYVDICGSLSGFVKQEDGEEERGRRVDGREFSFAVGDIVWVQTKNQSWWPGKICDPVGAPKNAAKSGEGAYLLVWYYGVSQFAWCFPFQLRPFHESFEEMSGKNRARIFLGAVEKALDEFGRCVKLEMTCSCDLKGDQQSAGTASSDGGVLNSEREYGRLGGFSVTNFESVPFLEHLKYLSQVVSMPCAIDFTVTQNRLSAFYSSVGHRQLPMHLLAEKDDTEEETLSQHKKNGDRVEDENVERGNSRKRKTKKASGVEVEDTGDEAKNSFCRKDEMMEKGFDSRERKKSRYLSYPYVNFKQKGAAEEDATKDSKVTTEASASVGQDIMSPGNSKGNGEKFWKKWCKRFSGGIHMPNGSELKNAASADLLRELVSAAVDGLHPNQNSGFTSVGWFFSRFRISSYRDESVDETCLKNMPGQNAANDAEACLTGNSAPETKPKRKGKKIIENTTKHLQGEISLSSPNVVGSDVPAGGENSNGRLDSSLGKDLLTAVKKPGLADSERSKTKPLSGLSDVNISIAGLGVSVKDALEMGQPLPCKPCNNKAKQRKKKKGEGSSLEHLQAEQTTDVTDLNGSNAVPSLNDSQVVNHVASEGKPEHVMNPDANAVNVSSGQSDAYGTNAKPGSLVVDLPVPQLGSASLNYVSHTAALLDFVSNNVKPGLVEKDGQPFGVFAAEQGKPMPKKRKRKGKKVATEHIPDLNGASGEPNSVGKETQETICVAPPVKHARKKRKRMQVVLNYPRNPSFSARPDMGTALLLTFGPGTAMPSREDLVSTFGKFGQLKESETTVSRDTSSAQIAFVKSADASEALKSVERNNPFGSTLVNFRLHQLSAPPGVPETRHAQALPQPPTAAPPLDFIKQNLQMMTSMLEKSGDSLSVEMRTKLEGEIRGLLSKVSSMAGSCS